jgi:hypothetical protein
MFRRDTDMLIQEKNSTTLHEVSVIYPLCQSLSSVNPLLSHHQT